MKYPWTQLRISSAAARVELKQLGTLLLGQFNYGREGILDFTHRRLFISSLVPASGPTSNPTRPLLPWAGRPPLSRSSPSRWTTTPRKRRCN